MKGDAVEVRHYLVDGLWRGSGEPFGQDGLDEDILVVEEEHGGCGGGASKPSSVEFPEKRGVCSEGGWISLFLGNRIKCCGFAGL